MSVFNDIKTGLKQAIDYEKGDLKARVTVGEKSASEYLFVLRNAERDEYDIAAAKEAYEEYVRSGKKSRPIAELWKELNL